MRGTKSASAAGGGSAGFRRAKRWLWVGLGGTCVGVATYASLQNPQSALYPSLVMPALHKLDAETAHRATVWCAARGLSPSEREADDERLRVRLWGKTFSNPVGLAAGMDKHAECMKAFLDMGFGFVEIGSVCPRPQPGNPKPRVFRLPSEKAIINRYGFNSEGMGPAEERLKKFREEQRDELMYGKLQKQPLLHRLQSLLGKNHKSLSNAIVGVNLGKNKDRVTGKAEDNPADDYVELLLRLGQYADYLVINVSSPNTPHLRELQQQKELSIILTQVFAARELLNKRVKENRAERMPETTIGLPILIKISPDITEQQKKDIAELALQHEVDGIIISNTTITRPLRSLLATQYDPKFVLSPLGALEPSGPAPVPASSTSYRFSSPASSTSSSSPPPSSSSSTTSTSTPSSNSPSLSSLSSLFRPINEEEIAMEAGGLSGQPLFQPSTKLLGEMYELTKGKIPLIGVGGISSGKDAFDKIRAGASLVQLYTGLVYQGPGLVPQIKRELLECLDRHNFRTIEEAVGSAHKTTTTTTTQAEGGMKGV